MTSRRLLSLSMLLLCPLLGQSQDTPGEVRFKAALDALENGECAPQHALLIYQKGQLELERYWPGVGRLGKQDFGPDTLHDLRSCSKSVVGLLVGIAIADGTLPPLSTPAHSLFPKRTVSESHQAITLGHLLHMTDGLAWDQNTQDEKRNDEWQLESSADPIGYVWSRPMARTPGAEFHYNSGATALLAGAIQRKTGMTIERYAAKKLFAPLSIEKWDWLVDADLQPGAHYGLRLAPPDMLKMGRLVLQNGRWMDRQLVPKSWIRAMSDHSEKPKRRYGFQWWLDDYQLGEREIHVTAAYGKGGQKIFVIPKAQAVVVFTAGHFNDHRAAGTSNKLFRKQILPVLLE